MLAVDLYCGLGGWADGLIAEGWEVIGFDIERHEYDGEKYPGQLVLQDVQKLRGSQFKDAHLIVASPPCQKYSYMAMPWSRAKELEKWYLQSEKRIADLNALFDACFRIQREASEAAGRYIPMIVENVRGAQKWVGRARWNYGSFYLWGDVPALMPIIPPRIAMKNGIAHRPNGATNFHRDLNNGCKNPGFRFDGSGKSFQTESVDRHVKVPSESGRRTDKGKGARFTSRDCGIEKKPGPTHDSGVKFSQSGAAWLDGKPRDAMLGDQGPAAFGSKSSARKAASARIAKIPFPLAQYIAQVFKP